MAKQPKHSMTYKLPERTLQLVTAIANTQRKSKAEVVELAIDRLARHLRIKLTSE